MLAFELGFARTVFLLCIDGADRLVGLDFIGVDKRLFLGKLVDHLLVETAPGPLRLEEHLLKVPIVEQRLFRRSCCRLVLEVDRRHFWSLEYPMLLRSALLERLCRLFFRGPRSLST